MSALSSWVLVLGIVGLAAGWAWSEIRAAVARSEKKDGEQR